MAVLTITAEFPLGVYNGHGSDGSAERLPEVSRLYSALVQSGAAGSLSTGNADDPFTPDVLLALDWLEEHAPTAIQVPVLTPVTPGRRTFAYRKEGVFLKEEKSVNYKVTERALSDGTSLAGPLRWIWEDVDLRGREGLVKTLDFLCADVPHLGETSSPVRLTAQVEEAAPPVTHRRDLTAGARTPTGALRQQFPLPGRRDELDRAHAAVARGTAPSVAADRHSTSARPQAPTPTRRGLQTGVYASVEQQEAQTPWSHVLSVPVTGMNAPVPEERFVRVCVAFHRALASRLGPDAPPEITGRYAPTDTPPANRVAIHHVPGDLPSLPGEGVQDRFLVLIPRGMSGTALGALASAMAGLRRIVTSSHQITIAPEAIEVLDGGEFWTPPAPGTVRTWEALPVVTVERRLKSVPGLRDMDVAAAWSLGNVLRDLRSDLSVKDPAARYAAITNQGVVLHGRALRTLDPTAYVHRTDRRAPVQPYRLSLTLGDLVPDRSVMALGQSRHLGCGLLVPLDLPAPSKETA